MVEKLWNHFVPRTPNTKSSKRFPKKDLNLDRWFHTRMFYWHVFWRNFSFCFPVKPQPPPGSQQQQAPPGMKANNARSPMPVIMPKAPDVVRSSKPEQHHPQQQQQQQQDPDMPVSERSSTATCQIQIFTHSFDFNILHKNFLVFSLIQLESLNLHHSFHLLFVYVSEVIQHGRIVSRNGKLGGTDERSKRHHTARVRVLVSTTAAHIKQQLHVHRPLLYLQ